MASRKSVPPRQPEEVKPTDCLLCLHFIKRESGIIYCEKNIVPGPNCKDENIQCVNYKPR